MVHSGDDGDIGTLIDFIRKGADFRLVIGNGLRIPAANLEIDENATKVVEMGIFESSRQVVDSKGNDIYEFLSSVSHINTFNPLPHMLYLEHCVIFYKQFKFSNIFLKKYYLHVNSFESIMENETFAPQ